jgi:HTH-type transcriptional regulator/antitoxin HigA
MDDASFRPDWFSKPGDTLLTLMERYELTTESLAAKLGYSTATIRGLLAGTVPVDTTLAAALSKHLGGTSKFWETRQAKYQNALSRAAEAVPAARAIDWIKKFPHADIAKSGWIKQTRIRDELIKSYLAYFGVNDPLEWESRYADSLALTAFRTSPKIKSKVGPLSAWLRQGEIEAAQIHCGHWNPGLLRESLDEIRVLTKAKNLDYVLPRLRRMCSEVGVALVFVRAPSGGAASGATRFVSPNKAMVILSFRYLSEDHFWFTFFHEIAHLLLHKDDLTFIDGRETVIDKMETEANEFSERVLIPENRRDDLTDLRPKQENIIKFAYAIGVSPGIVVGQMQHRKIIKQNQMNYLKRRFDWQEIGTAIR